MTLQRLIFTFKPDGVEVRTLYRSKDGPNPGTVRRRRQVEDLARQGLSVGDAARRANVSEEQVRRVLGVGKKQLSEGEHMTEHGRKLGTTGLPYGCEAAEAMIASRVKKLAAKGAYAGQGDLRGVAVGQLAQEGNLRVLGEVGTHERYLGEAGRKESVEDRQARIWLARAKEEAAKRGVSLSEIMDEKVLKGEVKL